MSAPTESELAAWEAMAGRDAALRRLYEERGPLLTKQRLGQAFDAARLDQIRIEIDEHQAAEDREEGKWRTAIPRLIARVRQLEEQVEGLGYELREADDLAELARGS